MRAPLDGLQELVRHAGVRRRQHLDGLDRDGENAARREDVGPNRGDRVDEGDAAGPASRTVRLEHQLLMPIDAAKDAPAPLDQNPEVLGWLEAWKQRVARGNRNLGRFGLETITRVIR